MMTQPSRAAQCGPKGKSRSTRRGPAHQSPVCAIMRSKSPRGVTPGTSKFTFYFLGLRGANPAWDWFSELCECGHVRKYRLACRTRTYQLFFVRRCSAIRNMMCDATAGVCGRDVPTRVEERAGCRNKHKRLRRDRDCEGR